MRNSQAETARSQIMRAALGVGIVALLWAAPLHAQYDPPADYYATVTGNPATLKAELHLIISDDYWSSRTGPGGTFVPNGSGHVVRSYDAARYALPVIDADPLQPGNIVLVYNGASVSGAWDAGATWNREHRWPDSIGLGGGGPDYSDMHQLAPCNPSINSSRGNAPLGQPNSTGTYGNVGGYWFPGDNDVPANPDYGNDIGDSARAVMYMAVRYDGQESSTVDLELKNGINGTNQLGDLAAVLNWHYRDVPSTHERARNHKLFSITENPTYYQGNRNPFVDHPEYVWAIFGDAVNDSKLYVGSTVPGDGASALTLDFGEVEVGGPVPAAQNVTLNKTGADPTYFSVTTTGDATCNLSGGLNSFVAGTGSKSLTIGLPAGITDSAGIKTGTITIDNLDLTNQGAGTGSLDGNDVITVSLHVVLLNCADLVFDINEDGDVDQEDFADLQRCLSGQDSPPSGCACFDRDGSGSINSGDVAFFLNCFTGPGGVADPNCDD